jgi:hypothetical protein
VREELLKNRSKNLVEYEQTIVGCLVLGFPQHPDEHCPKRPVFLAVDQELGEGAALGKGPELADSFGALEVGQHQDVEQLSAGSGS